MLKKIGKLRTKLQTPLLFLQPCSGETLLYGTSSTAGPRCWCVNLVRGSDARGCRSSQRKSLSRLFSGNRKREDAAVLWVRAVWPVTFWDVITHKQPYSKWQVRSVAGPAFSFFFWLFFLSFFHSSLLPLLSFLTSSPSVRPRRVFEFSQPLPPPPPPPSPHPTQLSSHVFRCCRCSNAGTSQSRKTCTQECPIASTHCVCALNCSAVTCVLTISQWCFRAHCFQPLFITRGVCPLCFCASSRSFLILCCTFILYFFFVSSVCKVC